MDNEPRHRNQPGRRRDDTPEAGSRPAFSRQKLWIGMAVTGGILFLVLLRLLDLVTRPACTETDICDTDYGVLVVIGLPVAIAAAAFLTQLLRPATPTSTPASPPAPEPSEASESSQATSATSSGAADFPARLARLKALRDAGTISATEYTQRRAEILREL